MAPLQNERSSCAAAQLPCCAAKAFCSRLIMKAPGATLPRLTSKKKLSKSKAEEHSHANFAKGPPTGSIQFHNFFETDLSVVTTPDFFHKMLRTFTNDEAPFFSVARASCRLQVCHRTCVAMSCTHVTKQKKKRSP